MKNFPERLAAIHPDPGQGERPKVSPVGVAAPAAASPGHVSPRLMEPESATLSPRELEHYLFVVESSLQVRKSHQFFLWVQGQLQSLLPHEILFCVHGDLQRRDYTVARYTSAPFPDEQFAEIRHPENGLVAKVIQAWKKNWEEPCVFNQNGQLGLYPQVELLMAEYRLPNLACHGTHSVNGGASSCFIFARLPQPPGPRQCYLLELLLPHLHAAFVRTMIDERRELRTPLVPHALTAREIEILRWVSEGKNNHQIGDALRISPLTVKNHIQNILKKLEVQNRAQAVTRAIGARLIQP
ncbi:MAG: XrtB/PEP-CTERM-associated transcriptional regulator EpsA [Burkholderiales bacterium]